MAIENLDKLISKLEKLDNVNQAMEQACILVENGRIQSERIF